MNKTCVVCGIEFSKPYSCSNASWEKRKLCSLKCDAIYRTGKSINKGHVKSAETLAKMSANRKGVTAGDKHPMWKGGENVINCKVCGKTFTAEKYRIKATYCSPQCKGKDFDMRKTKENEKIRKSQPYKNWRKAVFERDGYKCVECGAGGYLHADHIKAFCTHPELRLDINNGRTLCVPCHKKQPTYGRTKEFRKLTDKKAA